MNKKIKTLLSVMLAMCLLLGFTASAATAPPPISPNLTNLESGSLDVYTESDSITVVAITTSINSVDSVYHTITVKKNGTQIYSKKFTEYNTCLVATTLEFDAKEGDYFDIEVKHSAKEGNLVETKKSTYCFTFE